MFIIFQILIPFLLVSVAASVVPICQYLLYKRNFKKNSPKLIKRYYFSKQLFELHQDEKLPKESVTKLRSFEEAKNKEYEIKLP